MRIDIAYPVADGMFVDVNVDRFHGLHKQGAKTYVEAAFDCAGVLWFPLSSYSVYYLYCHGKWRQMSFSKMTKDLLYESLGLI